MNVILAKNLAKSLMSKHRLHGWTFHFTRKKRVFGSCFYRLQQIHLSIPLIECNSEEEVRDTILHEIAHAHAYILYGETDHGYWWKKICLEIGAKPERFFTESVARVKPKYHLIHSETGQKLRSYHRLPSWHKEIGLRFINGKRKETIGKLQLIPA